MKNSLITISIIVLMTSFSCSPKNNTESETEQSDDRGWVEMDSFHLIMTEAFHPYTDSANLEPARQLADEIASKAEYWASATLPDKVNTKEVKAMLTKLKEDTQALATMINKDASDEEIGTALQALHESFHGIMEAWHGGTRQEH